MQPILHNYFRSSTSHRVRTALALKGSPTIRRPSIYARGAPRRALRIPQSSALVPALTWTDGKVYTQSLAIIEYRGEQCGGEESVSQPPLKDKVFSAFLDQNPPFELRPENGVSPPYHPDAVALQLVHAVD